MCNSLQIYRKGEAEGRLKVGMKLANVQPQRSMAQKSLAGWPQACFSRKQRYHDRHGERLSSSCLCTDLMPKCWLEKKTLPYFLCSSLNFEQSTSNTARVFNLTHSFTCLLLLLLPPHNTWPSWQAFFFPKAPLNSTSSHVTWPRSVYMLFLNISVLFAMPLPFPGLKHLSMSSWAISS